MLIRVFQLSGAADLCTLTPCLRELKLTLGSVGIKLRDRANPRGEGRVSDTALRRLAVIRRAVVAAAEADGQSIDERVTTEDLVMTLVLLAKQGHDARVERGRIRRYLLDEIGYEDDGRSTLSLVKLLAMRPMTTVIEGQALDPAVIAAMKTVIATGQVEMSAGAKAGLREVMTGESGAIEVALTEHEIVDLVLSGAAFTEIAVGDGEPMDIAVKLVDTTGELGKLREVWAATGQLRDLRADRRKDGGDTSH